MRFYCELDDASVIGADSSQQMQDGAGFWSNCGVEREDMHCEYLTNLPRKNISIK